MDRERQILYDLTYMWNLKKKSNSETENRLVVVARVRSKGGGKMGESSQKV